MPNEPVNFRIYNSNQPGVSKVAVLLAWLALSPLLGTLWGTSPPGFRLAALGLGLAGWIMWGDCFLNWGGRLLFAWCRGMTAAVATISYAGVPPRCNRHSMSKTPRQTARPMTDLVLVRRVFCPQHGNRGSGKDDDDASPRSAARRWTRAAVSLVSYSYMNNRATLL